MIFRRFNTENARANGDGLVAIAQYTPAVRLIGNICADDRDGRRRGPGDQRRDGDRCARRVPAVRAADVRPAGRTGDVLQLLSVGLRGAGEDLRAARGGPDGPGAGFAGAGACGRVLGRRRVDRGRVRLLAGPRRATAVRSGHPGRPDAGRGRCHRGREVDAGEVACPVLRPDVRGRDPGRRRHLDPVGDGPAAGCGDGDPGVLPVLGFRGRQHRARSAVGDPSRDRGGGRSYRRRSVHPCPA